MPEISQEEMNEFNAMKRVAANKKTSSAIRSKARSTILAKYKDEVTAEVKRLGG